MKVSQILHHNFCSYCAIEVSEVLFKFLSCTKVGGLKILGSQNAVGLACVYFFIWSIRTVKGRFLILMLSMQLFPLREFVPGCPVQRSPKVNFGEWG